jgi:hypothetical protein
MRCKKPGYDDLGGGQYINGKVYMLDTLNNNYQQQLLTKQDVFVQYPETGTSGFLYSVKSDANGSFVFENLKSSNYVVYSSITQNGILFFDTKTAIPNGRDSVKLVLQPDTLKQNILYVKTLDINKEIIPKGKIYIYGSNLLAKADTAFLGSGSIISDSTNNFGRFAKYNLLPGNYYLRSKVKIKDTTYRSTSIIQITLKNYGMKKVSLILSKK